MKTSSAPSMFSLSQLRVEYKSGQSALGHHWKIFGDGDEQIGRTRRHYEGAGGKLGKRLLVATGLSTAGSIEIHVEDAAGEHIATIKGDAQSRNAATLLTPAGDELGTVTHTADVDITFTAPDGSRLGRIVTPPDTKTPTEDRTGQPYPIEDAQGTVIGEFARWRHQPNAVPSISGAIVSDWLDLYNSSQAAYEAELTRHRGFSNSSTYSVILTPNTNVAEPLRTLVILSPVLSGYLY